MDPAPTSWLALKDLVFFAPFQSLLLFQPFDLDGFSSAGTTIPFALRPFCDALGFIRLRTLPLFFLILVGLILGVPLRRPPVIVFLVRCAREEDRGKRQQRRRRGSGPR